MSTLYRARVVRIDESGVYVEITELGAGAEWGPLEMLPIILAAGDPVLVGSINNVMEDLALLGKLVTEVPDPTIPANGKVILVYENETARTAASLTLVSGLTTWLDDEQRLDVYTDEGTPGWVSNYGVKGGILSLPVGTKTGVGIPAPGSTFDVAVGTSTDFGMQLAVTGDGFKRWRVNAAGMLEWGPGNVATDVNLYRSAANTLRTDDSFVVMGDQTINQNLGVNGTSTLTGAVTAVANASIGGVLTVTGNVVANAAATVAGLLTASTDLTVGDDLTVTDDASIGGDLTVTGNLTVGGDLTVTGDLAVSGIGERRFIICPNGQTSTDATNWVSVTNATITLKAGATYWMSNHFSYDGPTASDFQHRWTSSSGSVLTERNTLSPSAASAAGASTDVQSVNLLRHGLTTARAEQGFGGSSFPTVWEFVYVLNPTGSQQTITLQFMQATAGGGTSTYKGGYIVIDRVA